MSDEYETLKERYTTRWFAHAGEWVMWLKTEGNEGKPLPPEIVQMEVEAAAARRALCEFCVSTGRDLALVDEVDRFLEEEMSNWFK